MSKRQVRSHTERAVQDGLSTRNSYVILSRNGRNGIHMALRPWAMRINQECFLLGGRLRIGFDYVDKARPEPKLKKHLEASPDERKQALQEEYSGIKDWDCADGRRCSTTAGILIAAAAGNEKEFMAQWEEIDFVGALLDEISAKIKQPLSGNKSIADAQTKMYDELVKRYEQQFSKVFFDNGPSLVASTVGEISGFVNTRQRSYEKDVAAFTKKVSRFVKDAA